MGKIDRGLVEYLDEPVMNLCLYGLLCIFKIQYMYGKSSSSSLASIPKEEGTDCLADAEKSARLYVGFQWSELSQTFLQFHNLDTELDLHRL